MRFPAAGPARPCRRLPLHQGGGVRLIPVRVLRRAGRRPRGDLAGRLLRPPAPAHPAGHPDHPRAAHAALPGGLPRRGQERHRSGRGGPEERWEGHMMKDSKKIWRIYGVGKQKSSNLNLKGWKRLKIENQGEVGKTV